MLDHLIIMAQYDSEPLITVYAFRSSRKAARLSEMAEWIAGLYNIQLVVKIIDEPKLSCISLSYRRQFSGQVKKRIFPIFNGENLGYISNGYGYQVMQNYLNCDGRSRLFHLPPKKPEHDAQP